MPRSGSLRTISILDACAPIRASDASVEPPSTTIYSLEEKLCSPTLRMVLSNPTALLKLIVTIVKSGSSRAITAPARALPSDDDERGGCQRDLTCDRGRRCHELLKVERSQISRNHDGGARRNDIRIVECQPIFRNRARGSVGHDDKYPPFVGTLRRTA